MKTSLTLFGALGVVLAVLLFSVATPPVQGQRPAGQPTSTPDHVTLVSFADAGAVCATGTSFAGRSFFRVLPDGSVEAAPFALPPGQSLVVTDVSWRLPSSPFYGELVEFQIWLEGSSAASLVFFAELTRIGDRHLTTGLHVGPDTKICPRAVGHTTTLVDIELRRVVLHGYLLSAI